MVEVRGRSLIGILNIVRDFVSMVRPVIRHFQHTEYLTTEGKIKEQGPQAVIAFRSEGTEAQT